VQADAGAAPTPAFLSLTGTELGVAALKRAHDQAGIVVRVYEPHGVHGASSIAFDRPVKSAKRVNLLEEPIDGVVESDGSRVSFEINPFELVSLIVEL
jgi:alpha-mannosidase